MGVGVMVLVGVWVGVGVLVGVGDDVGEVVGLDSMAWSTPSTSFICVIPHAENKKIEITRMNILSKNCNLFFKGSPLDFSNKICSYLSKSS